jgi:hypothetical protein
LFLNFIKALADSSNVPTVAIPGTGLRKSSIVGTKLQSAVVAVLEEGLTVNTEEFFHTLRGDPSRVLSHGLRSCLRHKLISRQEAVNSFNKVFISLFSLRKVR